jgi:hypothetical protein
LHFGVTAQPATYENGEKARGANRCFPIMTFPSKKSGSQAHKYLVVRALVDDTIRRKVVTAERGGYNIKDGSDDASLTLYLVEFLVEPNQAASPLREYNAPVEDIFNVVDGILNKVDEVVGDAFYSLGFSKDNT